MLRATLTGLLARKLRLLLSGTAVVLGVAFVCGALVLTSTLGKVFDDLFTSTSVGTDVVVRGATTVHSGSGDDRHPVPQSVLTRLRAVDGVAAVSGDVTGYAQVLGPDGTPYETGGAPQLGLSYDPTPGLSPYTLRSGHAPQHRGEVALDARTADEAGYAVGDRVRLVLRDGPSSATLTGIFGFGDNDNLAGASVVAFDTATAQDLLGTPGEYEEVRLAADQGTSPAELRDRVADTLPDGFTAATGEQRAAEASAQVKDQLGFVTTFLLVFAGVALFVGAFLIVNTFTMLVAQRTKELALLRALGASRAQVTRSVLLEASVVALLASALGVGAGIVVAAGLRALLSSVGGSLPDGPLVVTTSSVLISMTVGVVVTLLAALLPARRASAVPPVAAMRDAAATEPSLRRGTVTGTVLLIGGIAVTGVGLTGVLPMLAVGALGVFVGVALLAPLLSRPAVRLLGAPMSRGVAGQLGRLNAMRNPKRTASTAAALTVGVALVSAVSVLGASLTKSVETVVDQGLRADVVVQSTGMQGMPAAVAERLAQVPQVGSLHVLRQDQVMLGAAGHEPAATYVTAVSAPAVGSSLQLEGDTGDVRSLRPDSVLLSTGKADALDVRPGDTVEMQPARGGPVTLTVRGTYSPNELAGEVLLDASVADHFAGGLDTALLVQARDGEDAGRLQATLTDAASAFPGVDVLDRDEFVDDAVDQVEQVTAIVTVLLVLSVVIAVLGIVNTLALSVVERTRELGLLRAVGLSRRQTRRMIRTEAVVVAVFGAALGLVVGSALGIAFQRALVDQGVTELAVPAGRLGTVLAVAAVAGVLAAALPARRAARLDVLTAISTA